MQTKPINRADGPNSDNPATDTCSRITRARSDAMRSQAHCGIRPTPFAVSARKGVSRRRRLTSSAAQISTPKRRRNMTPKASKNPRGQARPKDGRGGGKGMAGGRRAGRNTGGCKKGGPGQGAGGGRGKGTGRDRED